MQRQTYMPRSVAVSFSLSFRFPFFRFCFFLPSLKGQYRGLTCPAIRHSAFGIRHLVCKSALPLIFFYQSSRPTHQPTIGQVARHKLPDTSAFCVEGEQFPFPMYTSRPTHQPTIGQVARHSSLLCQRGTDFKKSNVYIDWQNSMPSATAIHARSHQNPSDL